MFAQLLIPLVRRAWPLVLAFWGLLFVGTWLAAPPWDEVAQDRIFDFLPAEAPSRRAEEIYARAFPEDQASSNIVILLYRTAPRTGDLKQELAFIDSTVEPALRKIAESEGGLAGQTAPSDEPLFSDESSAPVAPPSPSLLSRSIIARIRTPNGLGTGPLLISPDGQALLVLVDLTTDYLSRQHWPTISKVEDVVRALRQDVNKPAGLELAVTGSAVIGRDRTQAQLHSAQATQRLTIILVIGLLILLYRAPLAALLPLVTVFMAIEIALNLLAILARANVITLFEDIPIYVTILAYGAGVDYCLFLTARYKERLDQGASPAEAVTDAVAGVGAALVASAATVICGIAMMMFAQFEKFREGGVAIPISLVLVLAATLTFTPALLRLAGRWVFWPGQIRRRTPVNRDGNPGPEPRSLFQREWFWVAHVLKRRPGTIWLITVAMMAPFALAAILLYNQISFDMVGNLPESAPSVAGTRVLEEHFPPGMLGPATILLVQPDIDFASETGRQLVQGITRRLREHDEELGVADIRTLTAPLGITTAADNTLGSSDLPEDVRQEALRRGALEHYTTALGERARTGTRLDLVLTDSPFSSRGMASLDEIEQAIYEAVPENLRAKARLYSHGLTASVRDLSHIVRQDRTRIELLVMTAVFLILLVLLRQLVVTLYLLASVLFSYCATLGVSFLVFWLLDPAGFTGIDWRVAIFLFTILVAVGEDYNIFLLTRVREEEAHHGPIDGVTQALIRTGPIISSCGIIMAGTFASLLAASLSELRQLGFALAFGVLLDTFVVRPILVPAFLILWRSARGSRFASRHPV